MGLQAAVVGRIIDGVTGVVTRGVTGVYYQAWLSA